MASALAGIKVLDLTRVLAGPYCSMILGDLGAEVIKVEAPGGSDDTRYWGPPFTEGESAYYLCVNRNKRAVTINLKSEQGKEMIKKLIEESDVLMENFKTGTLAKLGLDYEQVKQMNPQLIYCSITGFGQTGPDHQLAGYDFIIQAIGGLMSVTGDEQSGPMKVGVAISDVLTGLYATIGILSALHERNQSGLGQHIDISLLDSQIAGLVNVASNYLISGKIPARLGNEHPNVVPYQTFKTSDGEMVVAVGNDGQFQKLCKVINCEALIDDARFSTNEQRVQNRQPLRDILGQIFNKETSAYWLACLKEAGIPVGPIQNMQEVFEHPQVLARNMKVELNHPTAGEISLVGSPLKLSRTPTEIRKHPPLAGEHNEEVFSALGYSQQEIAEMKRNKTI